MVVMFLAGDWGGGRGGIMIVFSYMYVFVCIALADFLSKISFRLQLSVVDSKLLTNFFGPIVADLSYRFT